MPLPLLAAILLLAATFLAAQKREFWAFRSPVKGPQQSIDELLDARLAAKSITPNPRADHRTLIRRLYFDPTGWPPQPR